MNLNLALVSDSSVKCQSLTVDICNRDMIDFIYCRVSGQCNTCQDCILSKVLTFLSSTVQYRW